MKVDINLSRDVKEPYVVIHTNEITNEISELANTISEISEKGSAGRIIGNAEDTMIILEPETISVIRVDFMQVSKSASINLKYLKSVEPYFNGVMVLNLKDGEKEYISRKYVPSLKKYLGL